MEAVFAQLEKDRNVDVQGTHYASLINAYGCIQRDLEKALSTFDSVPSSSTRNKYSVLDAVVFESIVNVIVSHRRTDLIPEYINKMISLGIHMTAYIANFLIKGYANNGEVEKAREIFESMVDPATGVAAPNNHTPHNPNTGKAVGSTEPVYREVCGFRYGFDRSFVDVYGFFF
jgi:pentatricopeptide repeat protein